MLQVSGVDGSSNSCLSTEWALLEHETSAAHAVYARQPPPGVQYALRPPSHFVPSGAGAGGWDSAPRIERDLLEGDLTSAESRELSGAGDGLSIEQLRQLAEAQSAEISSRLSEMELRRLVTSQRQVLNTSP